MENIQKIATQLNESSEQICLIYAFNGTGKTKLSVAYKDLTKEENNGEHSGVYYNAYSEDLFTWDNDEENDNENMKLKILTSSLNRHHSLLMDTDILQEKLSIYCPKYKFELNPYEDREQGIQSITVFLDKETKQPIKISRGEERIFIWCFFLALFDTEGWADAPNSHFFIDDPVSSLDEHNIFLTAESILKIIDDAYPKKKIILTTHHIGLFSILVDRLTKGEKGKKYKASTAIFSLENKSEKELFLNSIKEGAFLFHLHLLKTLDEATKTELFSYHFVLLRQLLENIASFLGVGYISFVLGQIGLDENENTITQRIHSLSHKDTYKTQSNKMPESEEMLFREILDKIKTKYKFKF